MSKKTKISKSVIAAALTASAVIPVAAVPASAAANPLTEIIYTTVDGQNLSLDFDTFTDALNAEKISLEGIKFIKASDGKYYSFEDFTDALNASDSLDEALALLTADPESAKDIEVVEGTVDDDGKIIPAPIGKVETVSAINDITVTEGATPTLPTTVEVTFEDGTTGNKAVVWDTTDVDFSKAGTYTVTGDVADTDLTATVNVVVKEKAAVVKVESVSAINANTYAITVTFDKEVTAAEVTGTLKLAGPASATATFSKVEGNKATYLVNEADRANLVDGTYTVTPSFDVATTGALSTTYAKTITTTNVEGFIFTNEVDEDGNVLDVNGDVHDEDGDVAISKVAVEGATVKVGAETVKTDARGYYKIPVNPGLVKVEYTKEGENYFVKTENVEVKRNFTTVENVELVKVDITKLAVEGNAVNQKTGAGISTGTAVLEAKVDGEWVELGEAPVISGKYAFGNSNAEFGTDAYGTDNANAITFVKNDIKLDSELRVVLSSELSAKNLDEVYESKTVAVTLSNTNHNTKILIELRPIAELKELKMDVAWVNSGDNKAVLPIATNKLTFKLINSDGEELLVGEDATDAQPAFAKSITDLGAELDSNKLKEAVDLVAADFFGTDVVPTIPTGKYFLVVSDDVATPDVADDTSANAIAVVALNITEGQKFASSVEIEKGRTLNTTANFKGIKYFTEAFANRSVGDLLVIDKDAATIADTAVTPKFVLQKTVDGVEVVLESLTEVEANAFVYAQDGTKAVITSDNAVNKLGSGSYKFSIESDYVLGGKATGTATMNSELVNETVSFDTASTLAVTVQTKGGSALAAAALVGSKVELLDANGNVKATANVSKNAAGEFVTDNDLVAVVDNTVVFKGIAPGNYKVRAVAANHKVNTGKEFKVLDIQDQEVTIDLEQYETPVVQGYVKYNSNAGNAFANVTDATIIAYNQAGVPVDYVDITDGTYQFLSLEEGKEYKFVVRGADFETTVKSHVVTEGENAPVNFLVVEGGQGAAKISAVDSKNNTLDNANVTITAHDALYAGGTMKKFDKNTNKWVTNGDVGTDDAENGPNYFGEYDFTQAADAKEWGTIAGGVTNLSAGSYSLVIRHDTKGVFEVNPYVTSFDLGDINGTYYGSVVVPLAAEEDGTVTYKITGTITDGKKGDIDYVIAYDANGAVHQVTRVKADGTYELTVANNQTYNVAVYADSTFVTSKQVSVQGFNEEANFTVNVAQR